MRSVRLVCVPGSSPVNCVRRVCVCLCVCEFVCVREGEREILYSVGVISAVYHLKN